MPLRFRWKLLGIPLVLLLLTMALAACTGSKAPETLKKDQAGSQQAEAYKATKKDWPKGVTWSGSALGGAHYMFGAALAKVVTDKLGVPMAVEATGGPWQSIELIEKRQTDFGPVPGAMGYEAYNGLGQAKGKKYSDLRAVFPMFPQYLHWWAFADKEIKDFRDLNGRAVDMSGPGSFLNDYGMKLFNYFNIKPKRVTNMANFSDANELLVNGQIDAVGAWSGVPAPAAQEMAITRNIAIIGVNKKDAEEFAAKNPLAVGTIPANTYKGQTEPVTTLVVWTFVGTHKDLPEDFIYAVVKAASENNKDLVASYKAAVDALPENAKYATFPLHPGAVRYFKEKGIQLPDGAIPPEMKK
ncbi:NMT1-like family protein [Neomoorella glycerini]|uniref:NMT1-like family protein n=1 Tax=Neomoorella glycerini TaxID=55779 RepID=A0A6I5ZM89_9FIRM|nr:TAXI family TRAP transporter solute-binding subunit [Moorella glycerini]QGP90990.1 NMT1-like family protein [Moorella glycerini]